MRQLRSQSGRKWCVTRGGLGVVAVLGIVGAAVAGDLTWSFRSDEGAGWRNAVNLVWDGEKILLFGGHSGSVVLNDTLTWDGAAWVAHGQPGDPCPSPRYHYCAAYDSVRDVVVLFGGTNGGWNFFGDTWEWDGTSWTEVTPPDPVDSPSPRASAAMAFDEARGQIVLFGGVTEHLPAGCQNDTWVWDGAVWTNVTPAENNPEPRYHHALAYDPISETVLITGGWCDGDYGGTWQWDGTDWVQVDSENPPPRSGHRMVYDPNACPPGVVHVPGGDDNCWKWTGTEWQEMSAGTAVPGRYFGLAHDPVRQRLVKYGGEGSTHCDETWEGCYHRIGDINGDGYVNFDDINCFVQALVGAK